MKFKKYFFENFPSNIPFDINNPRCVLSLDGVDKILEKIILNPPYTLTISDFDDIELLNSLLRIDIIQQKNGKFGIAMPFFVESDTNTLKALSKKVAHKIANELISKKQEIDTIIKCIHNGYSIQRNLYHLLCAQIFDGLMFDYLEKSQFVTTSCIHKTGLDYLIILYEDTKVLNEYSDSLLCSYNRFTLGSKGFVSFGDSNGNRKDFYRYMRLNELDELSKHEKKYINCPAEELIENFKKMLDGKQISNKFIEIYEYFGYYKNGEIIVPIYDAYSRSVADELYQFVLELVKTHLSEALSLIHGEKGLLSIAHHVNEKDIANEIYHLIFGEVNELLVRNGFVEKPPYLPKEGRYFKSFEY